MIYFTICNQHQIVHQARSDVKSCASAKDLQKTSRRQTFNASNLQQYIYSSYSQKAGQLVDSLLL